jgi:hypothetical protein
MCLAFRFLNRRENVMCCRTPVWQYQVLTLIWLNLDLALLITTPSSIKYGVVTSRLVCPNSWCLRSFSKLKVYTIVHFVLSYGVFHVGSRPSRPKYVTLQYQTVVFPVLSLSHARTTCSLADGWHCRSAP